MLNLIGKIALQVFKESLVLCYFQCQVLFLFLRRLAISTSWSCFYTGFFLPGFRYLFLKLHQFFDFCDWLDFWVSFTGKQEMAMDYLYSLLMPVFVFWFFTDYFICKCHYILYKCFKQSIKIIILKKIFTWQYQDSCRFLFVLRSDTIL